MKPGTARQTATLVTIAVVVGISVLVGFWAQWADAGKPYDCNPNCRYPDALGVEIGMAVWVCVTLGLVIGMIFQDAIHRADLRDSRPNTDRVVALLQEAMNELDAG